MQEKPLTPYQKTQMAAAMLVALIVAGAFATAYALRSRTASAVVAAAAAAPAAPVAPQETLRDAVADIPARPVPAHATQLTLDPSWTAPGPLSADDLQRERLLAEASGARYSRIEALRRKRLGWDKIARRLGWPERSARLFARTGVLVGRPASALASHLARR